MTTAADIVLTGGVTASSVFWVVNAAFSTGASTTFRGNVITAAALSFGATTDFVVSPEPPLLVKENLLNLTGAYTSIGTRI